MQRLAEIEVPADELAAARAGDRDAGARCSNAWRRPRSASFAGSSCSKATAEDLLQDTLIAMFEHLDDFRGEAPFGIWVRSIAVSRCLMSFRSPWHRARVALESWTEDSRAASESARPHRGSHRSRPGAGRNSRR